MDKITILGVGNILMQDDAFGVRTIEKLQQMKWPDNVTILDGGTLGMALLPYLEGTARLLIVDAINADGEIGEFFCFKNEEVNAYYTEKVSIHELGINDLLASLLVTGGPGEVMVMGVKPEVVDLGLEMTPQIEGKIEYAVGKIVDVLNTWGVKPSA